MGAWGPGLFDCDETQSYATDTSKMLIRRVEDCLSSGPNNGDFANWEAIVVGSTAIYCAVSKEIDAFKFMMSIRRADRWRDTYFEWFHKPGLVAINDDVLNEYLNERVKLFGRLRQLAEGDDDIDEALDHYLKR